MTDPVGIDDVLRPQLDAFEETVTALHNAVGVYDVRGDDGVEDWGALLWTLGRVEDAVEALMDAATTGLRERENEVEATVDASL